MKCSPSLAWCRRLLICGLGALLIMGGAIRARAAAVSITEFVASNSGGLVDENGDHSDWIELFNSSTATVNLNGWYLTDNASNLTKWRLPATNLPPNSFLVVFASSKNRAVPGLPLHSNFALSAGGEYLALVQPDGVTIATEFKPQFPEQFADIAYGVGQNLQVTSLLTSNALAQVYVPTNGLLGTTWITTNFNDSAWQTGTNGVGYESFAAGFAIRGIRANVGVCDLSTAEAVLMTPSLQSAVFNATAPKVNYFNTGDDGNFAGGITFPGLSIGVDQDNYVLEATGILTIPTAGNWTFGVNSDDGFRLTVGNLTMEYAAPRGPSDTLQTLNLAAGEYPIRLVFFECGGGAEVELFAASGTRTAFDAAFRLVGDTAAGGLAVKSLPGTGGNSLRSVIATDVQTQMLGRASSAYVRLHFTVGDPAGMTTLTLRMKYDDGFVAYLNGTEVARRNAPNAPVWNSVATNSQSTASALQFADIDLTSRLPLLKTNGNVLALHGLNDASNGADFLLLAELLENKVTFTTNHYFAEATPGGFNSEGSSAKVNDLQFSPKRGWFIKTNFSVTITSVMSGVTIRYTTDGSEPSATNGLVYTAPVPINRTTILRAAGFREGFLSSAPETQSYIFLDKVQQQNISSNYVGGSSGDYTLNTAITQNPPYRDTFTNDLLSLPTVSIALANEDLFGPNGIHSNPNGYGLAWERAGSIEYMRPDGGKGFSVNCGVRFQGGVGRVAIPKHGFRVLFKNLYGPSKLDYDLYSDSPVKEFDTLVLKGSFNDHWLSSGPTAVMHRDQWCRDTQNDMGGYAPHGKYVHLYLNGIYWGVYNLGEKGDASYAAEYLGGDKEEYDALNSDELVDGTIDAWNSMMSIADGGITTDAAYTNISQYLNIPNFIDYMLMNFYAANTDWPGHNWNAARRRVPGGAFHFFSWDAEWTFGFYITGNDNRTGVSDGSPGRLYAPLRSHAEFRRLFGDHVQQACFNGGPLTPERALERWNQRSAEMDRAMVTETARWTGSREAWLNADNAVRGWFPGRTATLIAQLRSAGLYPQMDAPGLTPYGGLVPPGSTLTLTNPNAAGSLYYTLDGSDPRLWGGGVRSGVKLYTGPIVVTNAGILNARIFNGASWSALVSTPFYVLQDFSPLTVTEIMYHPPKFGTNDGDEVEFLELKNTGTNSLDLTGLQFTDGITFSFTNGMRLNPGQFFVLARNAALFATKYPGVTVNGIYSGKLDNAGEKLTLTHTLGTNVFSFSYGTTPPWWITPEGLGFSLVRADLAGNPDAKATWRPSTNPGGSPGAEDPAPGIAPIVINEILTHTDLPQVDAIELYNPTAASVNLHGWFLSDDAAQPKKFRITNTNVPAGGYVVFTENVFNAVPASTNSFRLSSYGESLFLFSGDANTNLTGYSHAFDYGTSANGVSFGRHLISTGDELWPAQSAVTLGVTNSGPRIGPVIINEVQYHPPAGYDEFVELYNTSGEAVPLFDPLFPTNTWRFTGLDYSFPPNLTLPAGGYLVLSPLDPVVFRAKYGVPGGVQIVGPYAGTLQDSGERLSLDRPDKPDTNVVPYLVVDEVRYNDKTPWPLSADGDGESLQRRLPTLYGNEPTNWFASGITVGTANSVNQLPVCTLVTPADGTVVAQSTIVTLTATASDPDGTITRVEFFNGLTKLGEVTNAPFTFRWTNAPAGVHALTARARDNRLAITLSGTNLLTVTPPPLGTGSGLRGDYYDNLDFTGTRVRRVDPTVNFNWGDGQPDPGIGADSFSVRWVGQVQPRFTETYTFYTVTDDGVRLWVNNQLLVNDWNGHPATENAAIFTAEAGKFYDLKMEFYDDGGGAVAQLLWSSPTVTKEVIPATQLYPAVTTNQSPVVTLTNPAPGNFSIVGVSLPLGATANDPDGVVTNVAFYVDTTKLGQVTTAPYVFAWANPTLGTHALRAVATDAEGLSRTSAPVDVVILAGYTTNVSLVATGSVWKYHDLGANLGTGWSPRNYSDTSWASGQAQLGYGDGDEKTVVSRGPNPNVSAITTYFRRAFTVSDPGIYDLLNLRVLRDDGVVVYVNGSEVFRNNMPSGTINYLTPASGTAGGDEETTLFFTNSFDPGVLIAGNNVVAAEIHQVNDTSSDISFDLGLTGTRTLMAPWITVQPASQIVFAGSNTTFTAAAVGSDLRYQWRFNGTNLAGQTSASLTLPAVQTGQAGDYYLVASNSLGRATSVVATLTVSLSDSDGDGIPDEWESAHALNPLINDAALDADGDGLSNLQEYWAGTDPQDSQSALRLNLAADPNGSWLRFTAMSNRTYTVQARATLTSGSWSNFFAVPALPTNREVAVPLTITNASESYFRILTP